MFTFTQSTSKRLNLSLPSEMYAEIRFVSHHMGISASALVYQIILGSLPHLVSLLRNSTSVESTDTAVRHLRGHSLASIKAQYDGVVRMGGRRHDDYSPK